MKLFFVNLALASLLVSTTAPALAQTPAPDTKIDLRLFPKEEVNRAQGCSFALWQANRDPEKDRFAHLFLEDFGKGDARQPARVKIGEALVPVSRIAVGGKKFGYNLFEHQLYRAGTEGTMIYLDLKRADEQGEAVAISDGTLTVVQKDKPPFNARVKGNAGCLTQAAPAPKPAQAQSSANQFPAGLFEKYAVRPNAVPAALRKAAKTKFGCNEEVLKEPVTGYQMSEESAIWELQCDRFATQGSSVFALVYLTDPTQNMQFLSFKAPPGKQRSTEPHIMLGAAWNVRTRTLTGISLGRSMGDCGTLERHRVGADGQFELIEYRDKPKCDGVATKPESFPLVFPIR